MSLSSTSSSDLVSSIKLNSSNYKIWEPKIKAILMAKKLWMYTNGAITKPTETTSIPDWTSNCYAAAGLILLSLEDNQLTHVAGMEDDPKKMWDTLENTHIQKRPNSRFNAYSALLSITKQPDEALPDLATRVSQAMKDIQALRPKKYDIAQLDDDLSCMAMIRSLGPDHAAFISQISMLSVISMETLREAFKTEQSNINNLSAHIGPVAAANLTAIICGWCDLPGHPENNCFAKKNSQQQDKESAKQRKASRGYRGKNRSNNRSNPSNSSPSTSTSSQKSANVAETSDGQKSETAGNASALFSGSATSSSPSADWCADTGASSHMTPHKDWFSDYRPHVIPVKVADGNIIYSAGIGSVQFKPSLGGGVPGKLVVFNRVLHVPHLNRPLLSIQTLTQAEGYEFVMKGTSAEFFLHGNLSFVAKLVHNLPILQGSSLLHSVPASAHNTTASPLSMPLWHRRFSHLNNADLGTMVKQGLVSGLEIKSVEVADPICEPCKAGNQRRIVNKTATPVTEPLQLIHTDVKGPLPTQTPEGYRYWIVFVDAATRHWAVYFMRNKDQAFECFKAYKAWVELATGRKIKQLQDDKGGEFISNIFRNYLKAEGIQHRHTMRDEPHSNGVAERTNGVMSNRATSILYESKLPPSFWAKAVSTVVHTHNRSLTSSVPNSTSHEALLGIKPDVSMLRVFGSLAYVHIKRDKRSGLSPHMEKAIFVGYPPEYKGWEFWNPATRKFVLSDRADFDERVCPGNHTYLPDFPPIPHPSPVPEVRLDIQDVPEQVGVVPGGVQPHLPVHDDIPVPDDDDMPALPSPALSLAPSSTPSPPQSPPPAPQPQIQPVPDPPRRSARARADPIEWRSNWHRSDYKSMHNRMKAQERNLPELPPQPADDSDAEDAQLVDDDSYVYLFLPEALEFAFAAVSSSIDPKQAPPKTYAEAMGRPDTHLWHEAACKEIDALVERGTWVLAKLPPGKKAIGSRWVFVVKFNADGSLNRYKGRLVIKGFSQIPVLDFGDTFASTLRWEVLRAILAVGAIEDLEIETADADNAFLNGDLDADIFMQQPEGFPQGPSDLVLQLKKPLYGLKQGPRLWHEKLDEILTKLGFEKIQSDASVWIYQKDGVRIIVPVFVDDMTVVTKSKSDIDRFFTQLEKHIKIRRLGKISSILGVKVERDREKRTIHLSQKQYIINMLERYGFADCSTVSTPIDPGVSLTLEQCPKTAEEKEEMRSVPYISAIGSIIYLAISTRPDISFAVGRLARYNANPGPAHWQAVKHLFRYLKGTMDYKLSLAPDITTSELFVGYSDADYGGCKDTGYSTGGYVMKMGSGAISWRSKLQDLVVSSTTEAEYVAAHSGGKEVLFLRKLFTELGYSFPSPTTLYLDNQSAISVSQKPEHHGRMKHLDLKWFWLRDEVTKWKRMQTVHCPGEFMPADILTKALPAVKVKSACKLLGLTGPGLD
jgi:hypothetical protein